MLVGLKTSIRAAALATSAMFLSSAALAETTITMWTFLDPAKTSPREVALKQMIDDFHAANPGVRVVVEPQDFAQMPSKFFLGHRTGTNPDIVSNLANRAVYGDGA